MFLSTVQKTQDLTFFESYIERIHFQSTYLKFESFYIYYIHKSLKGKCIMYI